MPSAPPGQVDGEHALTIARMGAYQGLRLTAVVDSGTASAAEIFVGALHCHKRLDILGTATFGKSEILEDFTLQDGSAITLIIARNYLPDGTRVDRQPTKGGGYVRGLQPDRLLAAGQALPASGSDLIEAAKLPTA